MKNEMMNHVGRGAKVVFLLVLAVCLVWRANCYTDPSHRFLPQVFLCLTGMVLAVTAFTIGLGFAGADTD